MVTNFLQNIDLISPKITLFYEGNRRYPTILGGLFTIIICLVIIISFIEQFISFLNYDVKEVQYYRKYLDDIGTYEFNNNKESVFININFLSFYKKPVDIDLNKVMLFASVEPIRTINEESFSAVDHWLFDYCSKIKLEKELISSIDISKAVCISYYYSSNDTKYYSINDKNFQTPKITSSPSSLCVYATKCVNNSITNQIYGNCAPENEIIDYVKNNPLLVQFNFLSHQVNSENSKNPDEIIFNYLTSRIQLKDESYSTNVLTFSPLLIAKKVGFLFNKVIINKIFTFQNYKKSTESDLDSENIFNLFYVSFENTSQYYKYSYKTIYDIFANITIIIQITFYVLQTVNYFFNLFIANICIQNIIFPKKILSDNNQILRSFSDNYEFNSNNKNNIFK